MNLARPTALAFVAVLSLAISSRGDEPAPAAIPRGAACARPVDDFFLDEVWAEVGARKCLTCHKEGGDAEETEFVLRDPERDQGDARLESLRRNRDAFERIARVPEGHGHRVLEKVVGGLDHGGKDVLPADSPGYKLLAEFVRRVNRPAGDAAAHDAADDANAPPFFEGVAMLDDRRLWRRLTLQLAARLPTDDELKTVSARGIDAIPELLDGVMREDAFYARLREAFHDVFLTIGLEDNPETILSYEHFEKSRLWYQKHDLSHAGDEKAQQKARYKLADDYRDALNDEPVRLIEHIVRNDRPFTEIVTADYIMVTPYTARGYGVFDEVKERFKNVDDPFEYIPVTLKALKGRNRNQDMESPTGFYPHAGLLSTFQYLRRYPTTETNRNRLRARMYMQHFLGVDALELAARVSDAAAATAKFEIPTMQAAECVVCHKTIDPIAGMWQEYYDLTGVFGRRKDGWYKDMFQAGYEGEELPAAERWRSLQWLGEKTASDPRFARTMVEHVYFVLTGRRPMAAPKDEADPLYRAKRRAYREQRREVDAIAERFVASGFNLKSAFKDWAVSKFYRADGLTTAAESPERHAELADLGVTRMLSPEQLERKIAAVFGKPWGRLKEETAMLYGGVDYKEVTERAADPSGAMGAIQRIMANDVACKNVITDFMKPSADRRLFAGIDPGVLPGASAEADATIRAVIARLHELVLGRYDAVDSPEVDRTHALFAGIVAEAKARKGVETREIYHCRGELKDVPPDPEYTIRAWRAVVTYLLRRPEFLYE